MKLLKFLATYLADFAKANIAIARQVLSPELEVEPETVEIDTDVRSDVEILALSNCITFTPGTLTMSIEPGKTIRVHVLDNAPEAVETIRKRLEKPLLDITRKR